MTHTTAILALVFAVTLSAQTKTSPTLEVYVIDVEGGNAMLFVSSTHELLLMDTGLEPVKLEPLQ